MTRKKTAYFFATENGVKKERIDNFCFFLWYQWTCINAFWILSGKLLLDKGKATFLLIMALYVWWMPEIGTSRLCEASVVAQRYDTLQGLSIELRDTQKHIFVSRNITLLFAILCLSHLSAESHKIREEFKTMSSKLSLLLWVCYIVFALSFQPFQDKITSL